MRERSYQVLLGRYVLHALEKQGRIWHVRFRDRVTGRTYCRTTRETDRRKAEREAVRIVEEFHALAHGQHLEHVMFGDAWGTWMGLQSVRPKTSIDQASTLAILTPFFGDRYVGQIALADVEAALHALGEGRRASTVRKYLVHLRAFCSWAKRRGYTLANPTEGVRVRAPEAKAGCALTREQAKDLLRACLRQNVVAMSGPHVAPPRHLHLAVMLSLHAGLRRANALGLTWGQVSLAERIITIPEEIYKGVRDHYVPIHLELAAALRAELHGRDRCDGDDYVLGKKVADSSRSFHTALKRAGLPRMRWHDLRHTACTWWQLKLPWAIAETLAGRKIKQVGGVYFHPSPEDLRDAVDSLPWLMGDPPAEQRKDATS